MPNAMRHEKTFETATPSIDPENDHCSRCTTECAANLRRFEEKVANLRISLNGAGTRLRAADALQELIRS